MAADKSKPVKKTEVISFRVTPEVAALLRKGIKQTSLTPGDFYTTAVLSLAINVDPFEAGLLRGRQLALDELSDLIHQHIREHFAHGDRLYRVFDELARKIEGNTP